MVGFSIGLVTEKSFEVGHTLRFLEFGRGQRSVGGQSDLSRFMFHKDN